MAGTLPAMNSPHISYEIAPVQAPDSAAATRLQVLQAAQERARVEMEVAFKRYSSLQTQWLEAQQATAAELEVVRAASIALVRGDRS